MKKIDRQALHIISSNSDITEQEFAQISKENLHNSADNWMKFFNIFIISSGIGFMIVGIVFFFAYNWAELHKFVKLGMIETLLVATTIMIILPGINETARNAILTGLSVLAGVLFAVFGQIYHTGANAFDFFMVWVIFISLWVWISNFAPLWLLYVALINTTIILYSQQVANDWSNILVCTILLLINLAVLTPTIIAGRKRVAIWFSNTIALAVVTYATSGLIIGIFDRHQSYFTLLIVLSAVIYTLGIWHGLKSRSTFSLSVIPCSIIIVVSALIIQITDDETMFLLVSLFIVAGVSLTIKNLINMQKKWRDEN